jgi:hypothetical protein
MRDNKQNTASLDSGRINMYEKYELNQWSQLLGVTQQDLVNAVIKAGNDPEAVKEYLRTHTSMQ